MVNDAGATANEQQVTTNGQVDSAEHDEHAEVAANAPFDLTILVPKLPFGAHSNDASNGVAGVSASAPATSNTKSNGSGNGQDINQYVLIYVPAGPADLVRDIRQAVMESAEGCWIGAHSFQRVVLKEEQEDEAAEAQHAGAVAEALGGRISLQEESPEIVEETATLAAVFSSEQYASPQFRRALKVATIPYTEAESRSHVLRLRDMASTSAIPLQSRHLYQPPPYDPNSIGLDTGITLYTAVRGTTADSPETTTQPNGHPDVQANGHAEDVPKASKKGKGKGKASSTAVPPHPTATPTPPASKKESPAHSTRWLSSDQTPFDLHLARKDLLPSSALPPPLYKSLQLSIWNPPAPHYRLQGHHLYLSLTTLEGETYHLTAAHNGFYVSKSDNVHFDPSPRQLSSANTSASSPSNAKNQVHHSLYQLLALLSPQFSSRAASMLNKSPLPLPDALASSSISNCLPAVPWLAIPPEPSADPLRSQSAFLHTGSTTADSLPVARDWNEELTSMRELASKTQDERMIRDRYAVRVYADFNAAAARGVAAIAKGDAPCLNTAEAGEGKSYLVNNILFTLAQDSLDAFTHLGGHEAARVTASKDLWAAKLLQDADLLGINTIPTAVVDYCGDRWIAQAIPPGIFNRTPEETKETADATNEQVEDLDQMHGDVVNDRKGKATPGTIQPDLPPIMPLRSVYGPENTDKPHEGYVCEERFAPLAEKIARTFHLAKHTVTDTKGRSSELWTPSEMHGVIAADGRSYVIELYRFFPVDVNFIERDYTGKIYGDSQEPPLDSTPQKDEYPHRVTLLRPELIETFHARKTREWIEEQVALQTASPSETTSKVAEGSALTNGDDAANNSTEQPESATSEEFVKVDKDGEETGQSAVEEDAKTPEHKQTVIDVGDFDFTFNPDAFADRPDRPKHSASLAKPDEEERTTKNVRAASDFLRDTILPSFIRDVITDELLPLDSSHLSQLLHKKGINIRYLGLLAEQCHSSSILPEGQKLSEAAEEDIASLLSKFRNTLIRDMVTRGSKHVIRRYIAGLQPYELSEAIAHLFNGLLGLKANQIDGGVDPSSSSSNAWRNTTTSGLRAEVLCEIRKRYRYSVTSSYFEGDDFARAQLIRELCISTGVQMSLRKYNLNSKPSVVTANGAAASGTNAPHLNGSSKKGKVPVTSAIPATVEANGICAEDIINVYGVVKKAPFKSSLAEEMFEQGKMYYLRGAIEHGEAFVTEAMTLYEQIYSVAHPELVEAWRTIASLYSRLAQSLQRRIQTTEVASNLPKEEDRKRARMDSGYADDESLEQARAQHEAYVQQAVRFLRQAVIVSERVHGLDSVETLHCYTDLAINEHAVGNIDAAMKLLPQVVAISAALYGPNHPEKAKSAYLAATIIKQSRIHPYSAAVPYYRAAQSLANSAYGPNSLITANSAYQLAQCYIMSGELAESEPYLAEALRVYESRMGADSESTREAGNLLSAVKQAALQRERSDLDRVEKLAKRIGSDPARARELMARVGASGASRALLDKSQASNGVNSPATDDRTGSRGHLEVDELVKFIQGNDKPTSKNKKKTNGKA